MFNLKISWYKVTSGLGILGGNESFEQEQQRQFYCSNSKTSLPAGAMTTKTTET